MVTQDTVFCRHQSTKYWLVSINYSTGQLQYAVSVHQPTEHCHSIKGWWCCSQVTASASPYTHGKWHVSFPQKCYLYSQLIRHAYPNKPVITRSETEWIEEFKCCEANAGHEIFHLSNLMSGGLYLTQKTGGSSLIHLHLSRYILKRDLRKHGFARDFRRISCETRFLKNRPYGHPLAGRPQDLQQGLQDILVTSTCPLLYCLFFYDRIKHTSLRCIINLISRLNHQHYKLPPFLEHDHFSQDFPSSKSSLQRNFSSVTATSGLQER